MFVGPFGAGIAFNQKFLAAKTESKSTYKILVQVLQCFSSM
jgi:hypothetical protein